MDLNDEQKAAVKHTGTPLLVLAGAGSGKTRVLTERAKYLIKEKGVPAAKIVLLTFTNKAAEEIKKRIGQKETLGFAGTFHTFCARMLRIYGYLIGLPNNFVIYDTDDSEAAYRRAVKDLGLEPKSNRPGMYMHLISRYKNELITPDELGDMTRDEFSTKLLSVWRAYEKILKAANAVDFDDLLVKMVELLKTKRMGEIVAEKYSEILIDEYQDTNKAQFELTKLLAKNPAGLMVVGDAAQAIYSFRGADFRNLSLLEKEYKDLTVMRLPKNYRSTQKILDAAYGVIANNTNHPVLKLEAVNDEGEEVDLTEVMDEREEAGYVARIIERKLAEGGDLAVLYRTNAQSRALEETLIRRGIEYKLVGGIRFYDRAEIKDLLAFLRVSLNEKDIVGWDRIEKAVGKRGASGFKIYLEKESANLTGLPPQDLLVKLMEETGYLKKYDERDEEDAARLENIRELVAVASEFETVTAFLENVALIQSEELADRKNKNARVILMTIHAAKGLEFDEVVITGLEEGLLPHSRSLMDKSDIEEERRLMYVAMTRARQKLHLTLARNRLVYGGRQGTSPSRFLSEIPEHLLKKPTEIKIYREETERSTDGEVRLVQDWEIEDLPLIRPTKAQLEEAVRDDFDEIDAW